MIKNEVQKGQGKNEKTLSKAGENEEKPNESKSTEQNTYRHYSSSICDYTKYLTPLPFKSMNISPISLIIITPGQKKVQKISSLYGMK